MHTEDVHSRHDYLRVFAVVEYGHLRGSPFMSLNGEVHRWTE